MSVDITIPSVGESVSSGFITQWHKADGEMVNSGDLLLTLDTDKISTEIAAESAGVLEILVPEGQDVEIGAVVGKISSASEHTKSPEISNEKENVSDRTVIEEDKSNNLDEIHSDEPEVLTENIDQIVPAKTLIEEDEPDNIDQKEKKRDLRLDRKAPVSPAVKTLAKDKGVDLALVKGTGKKGAILKKDVLAYLDGGSSESSTQNVSFQKSDNTESVNIPNLNLKPIQHQKPSPPQEEEGGRITRKPLSPIRRKIANHLVSAQRDSALLTTFNECDMSSVMRLRKELQEDFVAKFGVKLGFMSIFIKAVVDGLKEVDQINARIDGNDLIVNHFYDIGVAVGSERGLVVPVIRDCDKKSFAEIEKDIAKYATLANEGKLGLDDLQGGVFTISNGGIYGSMLSTPIINPPQSAILGMHNIIERPIAINGEVVIRPMMYLALSYDHRIVDGREAVTFLSRVKECIENPARLLVGA
ncbi:MAG: dihydrolipoyllysine-residue succinyltransferase [Verrucomicrobiales bacterium]|nr:dihydrolipoyllysine-residue succinyltransferase [Verrucomicrobiales bacterium]